MAKKVLSVLILFLLVIVAAGSRAEDVVTRWATGKVVATETRAKPNTIVVKSKTWRGEDLIVGAAVDGRTVIKKGNLAISLGDVSVGDHVEIVYERNKRVVAKSITVK